MLKQKLELQNQIEHGGDERGYIIWVTEIWGDVGFIVMCGKEVIYVDMLFFLSSCFFPFNMGTHLSNVYINLNVTNLRERERCDRIVHLL